VDVVVASTTDPVVEVAFGLVVLVVIIIIHGIALRSITQRFNAAWVRHGSRMVAWRANLLLGTAIFALAVTHLIETLVWSLPIYGLAMIPTMRDTYFFVLESYTTLGAGDVTLPDKWRLIGPIIAMSGLFTFGWTTGVLVAIMSEVGRLDRTEASRAEASAARPTPDATP
jgi:hypothetical protein